MRARIRQRSRSLQGLLRQRVLLKLVELIIEHLRLHKVVWTGLQLSIKLIWDGILSEIDRIESPVGGVCAHDCLIAAHLVRDEIVVHL